MFQALENKKIRFRRGQVSLICAGPGTGKSAFTLTLALRSRVPAMYFSADSDAFVQLSRSIAILMDWSMDQAEEAVLQSDLAAVKQVLTGHPIRFNYSASPSLDDIQNSMAAYEELYGDWPALVVVDNITNVQADLAGDGENQYVGLEGLQSYLDTMARETEAHVACLHHVTGTYNDANKPIPLSGVKGQITGKPASVLTIHRRPDDEWLAPTIGVSGVKLRGGQPDPSGENFAALEFHGERMLIRDPEEPTRQRAMRYEQPAPRPDLDDGIDPFAVED